MLLLTVFLISHDLQTGLEHSAYSRIKSEINSYLQELPSGTVILMCNDRIDNEGKRVITAKNFITVMRITSELI